MSRIDRKKKDGSSDEDGGGVQMRKRTNPSPYLRGTAPIIKDTYQIGDTLGKGAFGTVFRGLNIKTGEVVAIKQIEKKLIREDQMPQIMQELELLQNLYHMNIVQFIDYKDTPEYLYFILEYVEGGNLHDTMKKFGKFPESLLVIYITQVLRGLEYLHKQGVIHRDIKGANILLTKEGTCKLADFGSCSYAAVVQKDQLVGTPFWMAPEIISKEDATTAADIWSLGCTILELLTGMAPYWRLGADVAMYRMVNDDHPPIPNQVSEPLNEFLLACFIKDEKKRPSASELMKFQWIRSLWSRDDDPPPEDSKTDKRSVSKTVKEKQKSRSVSLPRIWANRTSGSHIHSTTTSSSASASPASGADKADPTTQELETVWRKIRGEKNKKEIGVKDKEKEKDPKEKEKDKSKSTPKTTPFASLSSNSKLSKEMKQLEEMDLSPQQFFEFLNWWKEWEQGQTKARSAAEAGIDGSKSLRKKGKGLGLKKKGIGTGRSVELILPPDYEYIQRIRKEVAAAAAAAAEDKKRKGVAAAAAAAAHKRSKERPRGIRVEVNGTDGDASDSGSRILAPELALLAEEDGIDGAAVAVEGELQTSTTASPVSARKGSSIVVPKERDKADGESGDGAAGETSENRTRGGSRIVRSEGGDRVEPGLKEGQSDGAGQELMVDMTASAELLVAEQDKIIKNLEEEDTLSLCRRLLALNKDNDELREKRTTLEALLVLEKEEMTDLQKAHEDLQSSLVRLATEKEQLKTSIAQLKEMAAAAQAEKFALSTEAKNLIASLQTEMDRPSTQPTDGSVDWMVPGAKCQALREGIWLDAVILSHEIQEDSAGNRAVQYGIIFIEGGGGEDSVRATAIRAPRDDGWGLSSGAAAGRNNDGLGKRRGKGGLFSWK